MRADGQKELQARVRSRVASLGIEGMWDVAVERIGPVFLASVDLTLSGSIREIHFGGIGETAEAAIQSALDDVQRWGVGDTEGAYGPRIGNA